MRNTWIVALLVMNSCLSLAAGADTLPEWTGKMRCPVSDKDWISRPAGLVVNRLVR